MVRSLKEIFGFPTAEKALRTGELKLPGFTLTPGKLIGAGVLLGASVIPGVRLFAGRAAAFAAKTFVRSPIKTTAGVIGAPVILGAIKAKPETAKKAVEFVVSPTKAKERFEFGERVAKGDVTKADILTGVKTAGLVGGGLAAVVVGKKVLEKAKDFELPGVKLPGKKAPVMEALPAAEIPAVVSFADIPGEIKVDAVTPLEKQQAVTLINQQINL